MFPQGLYNINHSMPIPGEDYSSFYYNAGWEYKFSFWPRRCLISNKLIWLKCGYKGTAIWSGPGTPAVEHQWHDTREHLIWKLKGNYVRRR